MRTRKIKTLAKEIKEKNPNLVSTSFEENKKLVRSVLEGRYSKKLSNRIAGYLVALKKLELKKEKAAAEAEAAAVAEPSPTEV
ncbi:MAG: 30S ribosomal protein S17e [Candidatus Caldarchaeum sp.]|nr:30S ribosomal protein S17e [Candidatus Caldarchaeum sp.]